MKDVLYTWVCSYLYVIAILFFSPPISTRFCKEEEKEWINRRLPLRFALLSSLNWAKAYLSVTGAIHPLILRKPLSACCLSPYRACGVVGAEPHTYMLLALLHHSVSRCPTRL